MKRTMKKEAVILKRGVREKKRRRRNDIYVHALNNSIEYLL
jgi:hypothetical protein